MAERRTYEPRPITPHPRVRRVAHNELFDMLSGEGDDLVEAGVLTRDMLPPNVQRSWQPLVRLRPNDSIFRNPGYLTVTRKPLGGFAVKLTVSVEEQARRCEAIERKNAEREARILSQSALAPLPRSLYSVEDHRRMSCSFLGCVEQLVRNGHEGINYAAGSQIHALELIQQLRNVLQQADVVAPRKRGHLTLAWANGASGGGA